MRGYIQGLPFTEWEYKVDEKIKSSHVHDIWAEVERKRKKK